MNSLHKFNNYEQKTNISNAFQVLVCSVKANSAKKLWTWEKLPLRIILGCRTNTSDNYNSAYKVSYSHISPPRENKSFRVGITDI